MPTVEVSLPDRIESEIDHLVAEEEFLNREQAVEELLSRGISAYSTTSEPTDEMFEETFTQSVEDQQDPALDDDYEDDQPTF